jgi:hypothetical protein
MESARITRSIRIAVTALCLTACVLLVALWVRSYWRYDFLAGPLGTTRLILIVSCRGQFGIGTAPIEYLSEFGTGGAPKLHSGPSENMPSLTLRMRSFLGIFYWHFRPLKRENQFVVPFWLITLVCVSITAAVPLKQTWRFSLRTLLIATTLIAAGLGVVVAAM